MNQENIGRKIAVYRKQMKLTQDQLGEKLSISGKTISKWERGISLPDVFMISKFCEMLNINIKELLSDKESENIISDNKYDKSNNFIKNKKNIYKKIIIAITTLILIIVCTIFLEYINYCYVFNINSHDDNFLVNGYMILNNKKMF